VKFLRTKSGLLIITACLLLALYVVRPGAGGLKTRIVRTVSLALARPVDIGRVHLRMLPQPGFDLEGFVVYDDPGFSAEPMLRAQEVTAAIRIRSLLRGRLEISRLSLTEPSLNLVKDGQGHWNIENLLEHTAHISVAPTSKARSGPRPGFPYIEADRGRINFKFGPEKKPYALTDADFALWQDSENTWAMRLKAQPVRTDFNLSDTGLLRVSGTWQRAATLHETPLQFSVQWDRAQLGQLTKLISGQDEGWRGGLSTAWTFAGKPGDLSVTSTVSVQDFHRYDIMGGDSLGLSAHCVAHYSSADRTLREIICGAPVGDGTVTLQGEITGILAPPAFDLTLLAEQLPIQALVKLARHAKKELPEDLLASGNLDAKFTVHRASSTGQWLGVMGGGQTADFQLRSALTNTELEIGRVPFSIAYDGGGRSRAVRRDHDAEPIQGEPHVDFGPFDVGLGRPKPTTVKGCASRSGYSLQVQGEAQLKRVLLAARTLGLPASQLNADGASKLDLRIAGQWSGFSAPTVTGSAQLNSVRAQVRGLHAPLEITSANVTLAQSETRLQNVAASLGDTRWNGSVSLPRHCASLQTCPVTFELHTDVVNTHELSALFNPGAVKQPWYRLLSSSAQPGPSVFMDLDASGRVSAKRLVLGSLTGTQVTANLQLQKGKLRIADLRCEVLRGKHAGEWTADFTTKPPIYTGGGTLERVSLGQVAETMHDGWITGGGSATYHVTASGYTMGELLDSAEGGAQFEMRDGILPHIELTSGNGPLHVRRFKGQVTLRDGVFAIKEGKLQAASGIYEVSGTASLGRKLSIRIAQDGSHAFNVTGTVEEPSVVLVSGPETQAALKP
jgi:AsmA family/AsmA-like C-terminal region